MSCGGWYEAGRKEILIFDKTDLPYVYMCDASHLLRQR